MLLIYHSTSSTVSPHGKLNSPLIPNEKHIITIIPNEKHLNTEIITITDVIMTLSHKCRFRIRN